MDSVYLVLVHSSGELRVFFENVSSSDLKFKKPKIVGFNIHNYTCLTGLIQIEFYNFAETLETIT